MSEKIFPCANEQLAAIQEILAKEQSHDRYHYSEDMVSGTLVRVLDHKRSRVANCIQHSRAFQEDVLTFLRAFELMLETVAGASTHGEKAARLRGLMELVSTAAKRVRERQFKESDSWSFSMADDVFRCDYPVRHWINKANEAEAEAARAKDEVEKIRSIWAPKPSV